MRDWLNTPMGNRPSDAPTGGGIQGFFRRFGTGFQQGLIPTRGQALMRGLNPGAYLAGGLFEGLRDAIGGLGSRPGAPLPSWMNRGYPGPGALNAGPPSPGYTLPDFSGLMPSGQGPNDLYGQGQGMMRAPSAPVMPSRGVGARGGEVVARGQAAQNFVGGLRDSMNQQNLQNQARNAMENMFRGSER